MKNKQFFVLVFCLIFLWANFSFSADRASDGEIPDVENNQRRYPRGGLRKIKNIKVHGIGVFGGIGKTRGFGEINYEELENKSSIDTGKEDENNHLTTFSAGIRYECSLITRYIGFVGFRLDILYQRMGMEIDNRYSYSGGSLTVGADQDVQLDYVVFNPAFKLTVFSLGVYVGVLLRADAGGMDVKSKFNDIDFGITFAVDLTMPFIKKKTGMIMQFEGVFGLINIRKDGDYNVRNLGFFFKMGYFFNVF